MATAAAAATLMERVDPYWPMRSRREQPAPQLGADALALGAEDHEAALGQIGGLQGLGPRAVVDADDLVSLGPRPGEQLAGLGWWRTSR